MLNRKRHSEHQDAAAVRCYELFCHRKNCLIVIVKFLAVWPRLVHFWIFKWPEEFSPQNHLDFAAALYARWMISPRFSSKTSAMRSSVSKDGLRISRSTKLIMDCDKPARCASNVMDMPRFTRSLTIKRAHLLTPWIRHWYALQERFRHAQLWACFKRCLACEITSFDSDSSRSRKFFVVYFPV